MADELDRMYQGRLAATEKPRPRHRADPYEEASARLDKMIEQAQPAEAPTPPPAAVPEETPTFTTAPAPPAAPPKPEPDWWDKTLAKIKDTALASGPALLYGAARGASLGTVDRLAGIGTYLGEHAAAAVNDTAPPVANADEQGRQEYLAAEDKATKGHPIASLVGQGLGGAVPAIISGGASAAAPSAAAVPTWAESLAPALTTPAAKMAAQGFVAGAMNDRSPDAVDQLKSGITGAAVSAGGQKLADATLGKLIPGATDRMGRGLVVDIMRNEETGASATPTARKLLIPKLAAATQQMRNDPILAEAARTDAGRAARIVEAKISALGEGRPELYASLDAKKPPIKLDQIYKAVNEGAQKAENATQKEAFKAFGAELESFWIPKWEREGALIKQPGGGAAGVTSLGVRKWVSQAQSGAANVLGQIKESEALKSAERLSSAASALWQDHLDKAAEKVAPEAVKAIRAYDAQVSGLLAMGKVFGQRAVNETSGKMAMPQAIGKAAEGLGTGVGIAYAVEHPGAAALGLAGMQAAKYAPRTARAFNDHVLVPLQEALARGGGKMGWATFSQLALEKGLPQGMARALYDKFQQRGNKQ